MSPPYYTDVTVTLGGIVLGGAEAIEYGLAADVLDSAARFSEVKYSATTTGTITIDEDGVVAMRRMLFHLTPSQRGVPIATLWRRAWYGGRKGRSAWRRLTALAASGVDVTFHASPADPAYKRGAS